MRILHLADLHLGRALGDLSREAEQRALVDELITLADELCLDAVLLAGDVFDAFTPPAWAEDLFFELLDGLAAGGTRAVLVIAGNHDSGLRLAAAEPLARRLGIVLAGDVGTPIRSFDGGGGRVVLRALAPQVVRVEIPGASAPLVAGLLPFLSEAKVARVEGEASLADLHGDTARYAQRLAAEVSARAALLEPDSVRVLLLHQFVSGGISSDSERRLRILAPYDLAASALPAGLDYIALGHLHRPQAILGSPSPAAYAGSPIAYSFSESGQEKRAVLVEIEPGRPATLRSIPLSSGRPLQIWIVRSLDEAFTRARAAELDDPIVEVRIDLGRPLPPADADLLFNLGRGATPFMPGVTVLSVRDLHDPERGSLDAGASAENAELSVEALFRELWTRKHGEAPDEATVAELLDALLASTREEESPPRPEREGSS
jgi:exonuclease SbcD